MILDKVSCYQAIEISHNGKRNNFHTISSEVIPLVKLELNEHVLTISHPDWEEDVYVFTANIRYATRRKDIVMTFPKVELLGIAEELKIKTPVVKRHHKNTK